MSDFACQKSCLLASVKRPSYPANDQSRRFLAADSDSDGWLPDYGEAGVQLTSRSISNAGWLPDYGKPELEGKTDKDVNFGTGSRSPGGRSPLPRGSVVGRGSSAGEERKYMGRGGF